MSLFTDRQKINNEFKKLRKQQQDLFSLSKVNYQVNDTSFIKQIQKVELDTTPTYYDLYNFNGITWAVGETSPTPASAYEATLISGSTYSFAFIYPVYGFAVLANETPESITDGATPWIYKATIAMSKTIINFPKLPDWAIDGTKLVTYVYNVGGSPVGNLEIILLAGSENLQGITVDFSYFYRWVKLTEGYNFEFYAIYPISTGRDLRLLANLYFYNPKVYYEQF